jgi:DNA-binding MurR/RpiR family transcriptional regulator
MNARLRETRPGKPASLDAVRRRLRSEAAHYTPRVRDAAAYALAHPNDLALSPLATLASASGIAAAAFIRLAQALDLAGYAELQRIFREPLQRAAPASFRERVRHVGGELAIDDPSDPAQLLRAFAQANIVSLEHLRDNAAQHDLAGAIRLIRSAQLVHVLGLRRSYAVASYLAYALNRVGRRAVQITGQGGAIAEQAGAIGPKDLLVAISFPPYAAGTLQVCEQAHAAGVRCLALTDSVLSPVARHAALVLQVEDAELLGFRSLTSAMCLVQTLAMALAFRERRAMGGAPGTSPVLDGIDC